MCFGFGSIFSIETSKISMEDPQKITEKINELNHLGVGVWIAVDGASALTGVSGDFVPRTNVVFNPNTGYPVKAFINTSNGEIKLFAAILFERDAQNN